MLILGQLGGEVIGGRPAVELLVEAVHGRVRQDLGGGQGGAGGFALRGVAQVAEEVAPWSRRAPDGPVRCGSTRGSGSISLRALMALASRSGASPRRAASSSAAFAAVTRMIGAGLGLAEVLGDLVR